MKAKIKAKLEQAIQRTLGSVCEDDAVWPQAWCSPQLAERMADAAEVVFNASFEASKFATEQEEDK